MLHNIIPFDCTIIHGHINDDGIHNGTTFQSVWSTHEIVSMLFRIVRLKRKQKVAIQVLHLELYHIKKCAIEILFIKTAPSGFVMLF